MKNTCTSRGASSANTFDADIQIGLASLSNDWWPSGDARSQRWTVNPAVSCPGKIATNRDK